MTNETISVPEIHCEHCKASIEGALSTLPGVRSVVVDIDRRHVDLAYDEGIVGRETIVAGIEGQGYRVPT